jgi:hypothetical protein
MVTGRSPQAKTLFIPFHFAEAAANCADDGAVG